MLHVEVHKAKTPGPCLEGVTCVQGAGVHGRYHQPQGSRECLFSDVSLKGIAHALCSPPDKDLEAGGSVPRAEASTTSSAGVGGPCTTGAGCLGVQQSHPCCTWGIAEPLSWGFQLSPPIAPIWEEPNDIIATPGCAPSRSPGLTESCPPRSIQRERGVFRWILCYQ